MDSLVNFIMGSSSTFDVFVAVRLALTFALIDMLKCVVVAFAKGVKS